MAWKHADSRVREKKRSLNGRILKNTILNILVLVVVCCGIMAVAMQSLANSILLDSPAVGQDGGGQYPHAGRPHDDHSGGHPHHRAR